MKTKISSLIDRFEHFAPPGYDWKGESRKLAVFLTLAFLATVSFLINFAAAHNDLFIYDHYLEKRFLREGAMMDPFIIVADNAFLGFTIFSIVALIGALLRYMYFFHGSRSIYTMRRLPKRSETWKRCLLTPLMWMVISTVTALFVLAIDFVIYILATPDVCLPKGQLGITLRYLAEVFI